jgi:hypothetical protein
MDRSQGKGGRGRGATALPLAVVALATALPTHADALSGRWRFETAQLAEKGCRIEGEVTFRRASNGGGYVCEFVSRETCRRSPADTFQLVKQSCTARPEQDELVILSTVTSILDAGPPDLRAALMDIRSYRADNFRLTQRSPSEMTGEFYSIHRATVRFWREEDLVS